MIKTEASKKPCNVQLMQVSTMLLASDGQLDPAAAAINAASAALAASDVPWNGPVGAVRVSSSNGSLCFSPTTHQMLEADFSLLYAGTSNAALVLEVEVTH